MRAAAAVMVVALSLSACTAAPTPTPHASASHASPRQPAGAAPTSASSTPTVDPGVEARRLLTRTAAAAAAAPGALVEAAEVARDGDLAGLVAPAWRERVDRNRGSWPVVVGEAHVGPDGVVELDAVMDVPAEPDGTLVLRWLPAATALGDAVEELRVDVAGAAVDATVDAPGARLLVPVPTTGRHVVRVRARYAVPDRGAVVDDGGPAGYGLLSRTDAALMLGHWLPLVALPPDDGPMQARGDVGAFPPAVFSVVVHHHGTVVSGGRERACPVVADGCTWLQGVGLRDLTAVVLADPVSATSGPVTVHRDAATATAEELEPVAREAADALTVLGEQIGPLPWDELDVVAVPLEPGAAGMEFPGLVWVDPGAWPAPGPEFGSYVLAHEVAHQWFHALVGSGSLSAPVVDESLAQYLSVVVFDALFGDGAGDALAARSLGGRHATALADGVPDEAPAQPLHAFASARSYGANVYGRGGQAWVDAERVAGRDAVLAAVRTLVEDHGLRQVDAEGVLTAVESSAPEAAATLARGWGTAP